HGQSARRPRSPHTVFRRYHAGEHAGAGRQARAAGTDAGDRSRRRRAGPLKPRLSAFGASAHSSDAATGVARARALEPFLNVFRVPADERGQSRRMLLDGHRDLSVFERHTLFHPCQNLGHRRRREVSAVVAAGKDGDAVASSSKRRCSCATTMGTTRLVAGSTTSCSSNTPIIFTLPSSRSTWSRDDALPRDSTRRSAAGVRHFYEHANPVLVYRAGWTSFRAALDVFPEPHRRR